MESDGEITKIKILHLDEFYNFGFCDFSIGNHLIIPIFVQSCQILKIQNLNWSNELSFTKNRYNSCRSRWVVYVNECIWMGDVGVWHPGLGLNRINRILIPTSYNYFSRNRSPKNYDEVLPGCTRVRTKKTRRLRLEKK